MLILSLETFFRHSDIRNFHVKVYLDNSFKDSPEAQQIEDWGIKIDWSSSPDQRPMVPKFSVPYLKENSAFSKFLCLDCDCFCYDYKDVFSIVQKIESSIASPRSPIGGVYDNPRHFEILSRKPQSTLFKDSSDEFFLEIFDVFLFSQKLRGSDFMKTNKWNWGWFSFYNRPLLDVNPKWNAALKFIDEHLNTTCDETLFMLAEYMSPGIFEDLHHKIYFLAAADCINVPKYTSSILHPLWGHVCKMEKELHELWNFLIQ